MFQPSKGSEYAVNGADEGRQYWETPDFNGSDIKIGISGVFAYIDGNDSYLVFDESQRSVMEANDSASFTSYCKGTPTEGTDETEISKWQRSLIASNDLSQAASNGAQLCEVSEVRFTYFQKETGQACTDDNIIQTAEQCQTAFSKLGITDHNDRISDASAVAAGSMGGCFIDETNDGVYFNSDTLATQSTENQNTQTGLCKGEGTIDSTSTDLQCEIDDFPGCSSFASSTTSTNFCYCRIFTTTVSVSSPSDSFYQSLNVCTHNVDFYMTKVELTLGTEILNWTSDRYQTTDLCQSHSVASTTEIPTKWSFHYANVPVNDENSSVSQDYYIRWIGIYDSSGADPITNFFTSHDNWTTHATIEDETTTVTNCLIGEIEGFWYTDFYEKLYEFQWITFEDPCFSQTCDVQIDYSAEDSAVVYQPFSVYPEGSYANYEEAAQACTDAGGEMGNSLNVPSTLSYSEGVISLVSNFSSTQTFTLTFNNRYGVNRSLNVSVAPGNLIDTTNYVIWTVANPTSDTYVSVGYLFDLTDLSRSKVSIICMTYKSASPYQISAMQFLDSAGVQSGVLMSDKFQDTDVGLDGTGCRFLEDDEYLTHVVGGFENNDEITGFVMRTNKKLLFWGHFDENDDDAISQSKYDNIEWDLGTQISGSILGFYASVNSSSKYFEAIGFAVALDNCFPNLYSPYVYFLGQLVNRKLYQTDKVSDYANECGSRHYEIDSAISTNYGTLDDSSGTNRWTPDGSANDQKELKVYYTDLFGTDHEFVLYGTVYANHQALGPQIDGSDLVIHYQAKGGGFTTSSGAAPDIQGTIDSGSYDDYISGEYSEYHTDGIFNNEFTEGFYKQKFFIDQSIKIDSATWSRNGATDYFTPAFLFTYNSDLTWEFDYLVAQNEFNNIAVWDIQFEYNLLYINDLPSSMLSTAFKLVIWPSCVEFQLNGSTSGSIADYTVQINEDHQTSFTLAVQDCYWATERPGSAVTTEDYATSIDSAYNQYVEYTVYLDPNRRRLSEDRNANRRRHLSNAKEGNCNSPAYRVWSEPSDCLADDCNCDGERTCSANVCIGTSTSFSQPMMDSCIGTPDPGFDYVSDYGYEVLDTSHFLSGVIPFEIDTSSPNSPKLKSNSPAQSDIGSYQLVVVVGINSSTLSHTCVHELEIVVTVEIVCSNDSVADTTTCDDGFWCDSDTDGIECLRIECTSDTDCSSGQTCSEQKQCEVDGTVCYDHSDCGSNYCHPDSSTCEDCTADSDCSGTTNLCSAFVCVNCTQNSDCSDTTNYCMAGGICSTCSDHSDCDSNFCDSSGNCSNCSANTDCLSMFCNTESFTCEDCTSDQQCSTNLCNADMGMCVSCSNNVDSNTSLCNTMGQWTDYWCFAGNCFQAACLTNSDCSLIEECSSDKTSCNAKPCNNDVQCQTNLCDNNVCKFCTSSLDCSADDVCDDTGTCTLCSYDLDEDSTTCDDGYWCNAQSDGICYLADCMSDSDCEITEYCKGTDKACYQQTCETNSDCRTNLCSNGSCITCSNDDQCQGNSNYCSADLTCYTEKTCTTENRLAECYKTDHCTSSLVCGECDPDTDPCTGSYACSSENICIYEEQTEEEQTEETSAEEYQIQENTPYWTLEENPLFVDFTEISLDTTFSPYDHVVDDDANDEITVTVELGQASTLFMFDGTTLFMQLPEDEYYEVVDEQFAPGKTTSITLTATDLTGNTADLVMQIKLDEPDEEIEEANVTVQEETTTDDADSRDVEIEVVEEEQQVTQQTDSDLQFDGDFEPEYNFWEPQIVVTEEGEELRVPKAMVSEITQQGRVKVAFNVEMDFPSDFAEKVSGSGRRLRRGSRSSQQQENSIIEVDIGSEAKFDWEVELINNKEFDIQIYFEDAISISASEIDRLEVYFSDPDFFKSRDGNLRMDLPKIVKALPTQVPLDDPVYQAMESMADSFRGAGLATGSTSAVFGFLVGSSLNLLYGVLHMIQMYVHYPLFHIAFPGNIFGILKVFISIAQLDLFTSEKMYSETFNYNPHWGMHSYNDRFDLLGYDTQSIIYNMGDLGVLQFAIFVKLIYLAIYAWLAQVQICNCCTKRNQKFAKKYEDEKISIFWNWPIRFIFEAYLELSVSGLIKWKGKSYSFHSAADGFDSILSIFYLVIVLVAPLFHFYYFAINDRRLQIDEAFFAKFETVFEATKVDKIYNIYYNGIFMFRRLTFVLVCIYCNDELYFIQVGFALITQMFYIGYLVTKKPQRDPSENKLELFTEICILGFIYTMMGFTNYVLEPQAKFDIGFASVGIFFLNILVNLLVVIKSQCSDLKLKCTRNRLKARKWCIAKGCMKETKTKKEPSDKYADNGQVDGQVAELAIPDEENIEEKVQKPKVQFFSGKIQQIVDDISEDNSYDDESFNTIQSPVHLDVIQEMIEDDLSSDPNPLRIQHVRSPTSFKSDILLSPVTEQLDSNEPNERQNRWNDFAEQVADLTKREKELDILFANLNKCFKMPVPGQREQKPQQKEEEPFHAEGDRFLAEFINKC